MVPASATSWACIAPANWAEPLIESEVDTEAAACSAWIWAWSEETTWAKTAADACSV